MTPIAPTFRDAHGCARVPSEEVSSAYLVSRILEGNDGSLRLSRETGENGLRAALSALPASARRRLEADTSGQLDSLVSLSRERDPESFFAALLEIARDLETRERYELSGRIYMTVVAFNRHPGCAEPRRRLAERAQARLDFFTGRGSWTDYASLFLRQSLDPADLVAFSAAGVAARALRFRTLGRLLRSGERLARQGRAVPWAYRAAGAGTFSVATGIAVEAPAFVLSSHLSQTALGRGPDYRPGALGRELRDAYLFFGPARALSEGVSALATRRMRLRLPQDATFRQRLKREAAFQLGLIGGVYLTHRLQTAAGADRTTAASAESLADSARLFLQFNAMRAPAAWLLRRPPVPGV